jgi:farnesyl-diphosphate farnesyltransferase
MEPPTAPPTADADRAWCATELPRVSRTFALNIRLLSGTLREAVTVAYLLCRAADALEDSWPGTPDEIRARFDLLLLALGDDPVPAEALAARARALPAGGSDLELLAGLPRVRRSWLALAPGDRTIVAEGVRTMAQGMSRYAARAAGRPAGAPYLDDEAELHDYCWVVAGCVGVMLTRLFAARSPAPPELERRRLELAPDVGEALQLTNILLDWPVDAAHGRCHVPATWLAEHGLSPAELAGPPQPGALALARRLDDLARAALARVPEYLATLPPGEVRYRLLVLLPALWARASLDHAWRSPGFPLQGGRRRLPRARLWSEALRGLIGHRGAAAAALRDGPTRARPGAARSPRSAPRR